MVIGRSMRWVVAAGGWLGMVVASAAVGQTVAGGPMVAGGPSGLVDELDYERGHVVAREIVSFGHAIVGELIEPHYHRRQVCYEPHLPDTPPLSIRHIEDYTTGTSEVAARYRHAHHHGNVVEEHAHHYDGYHDHHPGSPLDYLAAYERYQRAAQEDGFDEYVFVLERFERKVPTYRIHGSPGAAKPAANAKPPAEKKSAAAAPAAAPNGEAIDDVASTGEVPPVLDRGPAVQQIRVLEPDAKKHRDGKRRDGHADDADRMQGDDEQAGGDRRHDDGSTEPERMVDRFRERRREAREQFDGQTGTRIDPARNRREMHGRHGRQERRPPYEPSLSQRIAADQADLGARIDARTLEQSNRLDQRLIEAVR